jgi:hypothetical protein
MSIIPAQGEPGTTVIVSGSGFTENTSLLFAAKEVPVTHVGAKQLSIEVPDLPPGLYALFLKRPDGTASRTYSFTILPRRPIVLDLSPDAVSACSAGDGRQVTVSGHNFRPGSQLLFDGAAIRSRFVSPDALTFIPPQVAGGLHQVQVKNPDETLSGVLGLMIDARPEIAGVASGEEYVNYYNLYINGKNFQQGSALVVMEERSLELMGQQYGMDVKRLYSGISSGGAERDRIVYVDCNRIIYQRYPYSTVPKNFKVQVINPDGSESAMVSVSAP